MDTLTHALSGALLARATAPSPSPDALPLGRRVALGFFAAASPDLDVIASWISPLAYLYYHRGITHSLLMLPLWAFVLAWLCALLWRGDRGWRAYFGVIALGIGSHIAGDWITSFGTMMLAPFSDTRFKLSTTFIIDLWFTGIILAGLMLSLAWRKSRAPAALAVVALAAYVAFQFSLQQRALEFAEAYAQSAGLKQAKVSAMPRPVSPFNWMVVVDEGERYHYALISLSRREIPPQPTAETGFIARLAAPYLPLDRAIWVGAERYGPQQQAALAREALQQPQLAFFRWFAEYPALYRIDSGNPSTCIWFQDLRFLTPGRNAWPFRYGLCREGVGSWAAYELNGDNKRLPVY
ncbi:MAG: metal-dependent hydrolase [Pseudomonadota bacterium]